MHHKRRAKMRNLVVMIFLAITAVAFACTSAIVSAGASKSGRPLLWKHRDTGTENNFVARVEALDSSRLDYVALFNAGDSLLAEAWIGVNEVGFAVMNTASYNLSPDTAIYKDQEGRVMSEALSRCRTLRDFEQLLDSMPKPRGVQANFGVIDASGAGAYYETDDYFYRKYPLEEAESGVLIRTNYSHSGVKDAGFGYIRECNAEQLLAPYIKRRNIEPAVFTEVLSRSFYHSLIGRDMSDETTWVVDQDFIPRYSSSASIVIEGAKSGDSNDKPIMWTVIGYPPCSYVLPVTVDSVPDELLPNADWHSVLCDSVVARKREVFSITRGSGRHYINMPMLQKYTEKNKKKSLENYSRETSIRNTNK